MVGIALLINYVIGLLVFSLLGRAKYLKQKENDIVINTIYSIVIIFLVLIWPVFSVIYIIRRISKFMTHILDMIIKIVNKKTKAMKNKQYKIKNLKNYPENGKHLECIINLPFEIKKGEDGYYYYDKNGQQHKYNLFDDPDKVDDRWIINLSENSSLYFVDKFFEIKTSKDLDKLVGYAAKTYIKALQSEINRVKKEFKDYL